MDTVRRFQGWAAGYAGDGPAVLRVGLGAAIPLAGVHELLAPGAWTDCVVGWFAERWPLSLEMLMRANGVAELLVGAALLVGVYTTVAAAIVAVSMAAVVLDLAWVATASGRFLDVLVRDVGLLALAVGVTLLSAE